ncbi:MAG: phage capsid protein, partial [Akkermansia sp.]
KGAKGNEPVNIPESQKLAITTGGGSQAVSLNLEKLLCVRQILEENESLSDDCMNSGDKLVMMVNSSMLKALLQEEKLTSSDYQAVQALVNGTINEALGIRFVRTELLLKDANGNPQALAYMKSGLAFSTWKGLEVKVDELMEQNYDYQIWAQQNFGATRMDEKKFVIVPCKYMPAI